MTRPIEHKAGCPGGPVRLKVGTLGDTLLRCRGCGRFVPADEDIDDEPPQATPDAARPVRVSLVCRDHPDVAVNARGRGCRRCDAEQAMSRVDRRARRRRELAGQDQPEWDIR